MSCGRAEKDTVGNKDIAGRLAAVAEGTAVVGTVRVGVVQEGTGQDLQGGVSDVARSDVQR